MSTVGNKGGPYRDLQADNYPAITVLSEFQRAIHDGGAYGLSQHGSIGAAPGAVQFLGIVGDKEIHFDSFAVALQKGGVHIHLYEAPTITANGTPVTPISKNRARLVPATLQTFTAPSLSAKGTLLFDTLPPLTGVGVNVSSTDGGITEGWILKKDTAYLFELLNTDTSACNFDIVFEWHESTISLGA